MASLLTLAAVVGGVVVADFHGFPFPALAGVSGGNRDIGDLFVDQCVDGVDDGIGSMFVDQIDERLEIASLGLFLDISL